MPRRYSMNKAVAQTRATLAGLSRSYELDDPKVVAAREHFEIVNALDKASRAVRNLTTDQRDAVIQALTK